MSLFSPATLRMFVKVWNTACDCIIKFSSTADNCSSALACACNPSTLNPAALPVEAIPAANCADTFSYSCASSIALCIPVFSMFRPEVIRSPANTPAAAALKLAINPVCFSTVFPKFWKSPVSWFICDAIFAVSSCNSMSTGGIEFATFTPYT